MNAPPHSSFPSCLRNNRLPSEAPKRRRAFYGSELYLLSSAAIITKVNVTKATRRHRPCHPMGQGRPNQEQQVNTNNIKLHKKSSPASPTTSEGTRERRIEERKSSSSAIRKSFHWLNAQAGRQAAPNVHCVVKGRNLISEHRRKVKLEMVG